MNNSNDPISSSSFPLVTATGIEKQYSLGKRTIEVLRGISIAVEKGEFVSLSGSSGAGKSTLLHILGGLDLPDQGEVRFNNQPLSAFSANNLARFRNQHVGFIFQGYHLFPELDALENVLFPSLIGRQSSSDTRQRAQSLLQRVGLQDRMDHLPNELSGGEQQRVAIARSLMNQPDLLLADEPTGNLDSRNSNEIIDLIDQLREELQLTVLLATHDLAIAERAPRKIWLADGRISS